MSKPTTRFSSLSRSSQQNDSRPNSPIFKTWQEVQDYLNYEMIYLPWDADGVETLAMLRQNFGKTHADLFDPYLDALVKDNLPCETYEQARRLADELETYGLKLYNVYSIGGKVMTTLLDDSEHSKSFANRCSALKHPWIRLVALHSSIAHPLNDDIQAPVQTAQIVSCDDQYYILDNFLILINYSYERFDPRDICTIKAYDLRYWPLRPAKTDLVYDRNNLMPYRLTIQTEWGEMTVYDGSDRALRDNREWVKAVRDENGEYQPDNMSDTQDHSLVLPALAGEQIQQIPYFCHTKPCFSLNGCIYYCYYDDRDLEYSISKDLRRSNQPHTLLEYALKTNTWRTIELPHANCIDASRLFVYRHTWIVVWPRLFRNAQDQSYAFYLWNPKTNEKLYMMNKDLGYMQVEQLISLDNGDLLIMLEDGRICRFDTDIVAWLKSIGLHDAPVTPWQNEVRRDFDGFPIEEPASYIPRTRYISPDDRMRITFENGRTLDIEFLRNKEYHRTMLYSRSRFMRG